MLRTRGRTPHPRFAAPRALLVAALSLASVGLAACGASSHEVPTATGPAIGKVDTGGGGAAPDLGGTDPITGQHVSLAEFDGKPILLNFWASWCVGCRDEAAALRQVAQTHPEAIVLGVDVNDSKGAAAKFAQKYGLEHSNIFDPDGSLAARYAVIGLPTTIFLDAGHHVVAKILGAGKVDAFERGLAQASDAAP